MIRMIQPSEDGNVLELTLNITEESNTIKSYKKNEHLRKIPLLIRYLNGYQLRSTLLNVINIENPTLGTRLHNGNDIRPYSIRQRRNGCGIDVILSVFDQTLIDDFIECFKKPKSVNINGIDYELISKDIHLTTFDDLYNLGFSDHGRTVSVRFMTNTQLRNMLSNFRCRIPRPDLILYNLNGLWSAFSPEDLKIDSYELKLWAAKHMAIISHRIGTFSTDSKDNKFTGFRGTVKFVVDDNDDNGMDAWPYILLKFGEISNVGSGRTEGFGQIKVEEG